MKPPQFPDDRFNYFYNDEGFGPQIDSEPVPTSVIEAYRGKLPDALLTYWGKLGWGGYGNGLLWLVDPGKYAGVLRAWIHGTEMYSKDRYYVFAYSAFGDIYVWGERTGQSILINAPNSCIFPTDSSEKIALGKADSMLRSWFSSRDKEKLDEEDVDNKPLFERAVKLLGRPKPDEMFGFVPALALGGPRRLDHLQKLNAVEHLMFLAQIKTPRVMRDVVKEAKNQGIM